MSILSLKNIRINFLVVLLLVLYIFNIIPVYTISKLGTREYLSIISMFFIFPLYFKNRIYRTLIWANWTQILLSILAALLNGTTDFWYVQFALRNILYLNGALFILGFLPKYYTFTDFVWLIVIAIIVNSAIASVCFVNSSAMSILLSIQHINEDKVDNVLRWSARMIGLGCGNFYVGGIINGMGLMLTFFLLVHKKITIYLGAAILSFLLLAGVFIARTTIIGFLIGLFFYLLSTKAHNLIGLATLFLFFIVIVTYMDIFSGVDTGHAFEFFTTDTNSYQSAGTMVSLKNMYQRSFSFETLILGDGLSKNPDGSYYMQTDVGYLRNIFYFGLVGTLFGYFYYEYVLLKTLYKLSPDLKRLSLIMALFLLILNLKGLPDFNFMLFLLISYYIRKNYCISQKMGQLGRNKNRTI